MSINTKTHLNIIERKKIMFGKIYFVIVVAVLTATFAFSHDEKENKSKNEIAVVLKNVAKAWENGDSATFRKLYTNNPSARMIESGGQNIGVEDLIEHHVLPERDALVLLKLTSTNVEINLLSDDYAWAIQDFDIFIKTKDGKEINNRGFETFVLKKIESTWQILHSHSSSRKKSAKK